MADKTKDYKALSASLSEIIAWFESDEVDLDSAVKKYEQALAVMKQMQTYLDTAENKIKKISAK
jgi:exodeoxyribonuclease VII small subunit